MKKKDIVEEVSQKASLTKTAAEKTVDAITTTVSSALTRGESVTVEGFGTFLVTTKPARLGRSGAETTTGETRVAELKLGGGSKTAVAPPKPRGTHQDDKGEGD